MQRVLKHFLCYSAVYFKDTQQKAAKTSHTNPVNEQNTIQTDSGKRFLQKSRVVESNIFSRFNYFFNVRCFSACSTVFSSTYSPFLRLTLFMYFRAWFSESAFSPKCVYSSSVVGTQNGSISTTYDKKGKKRSKGQVRTAISRLCQGAILTYRKQYHG